MKQARITSTENLYCCFIALSVCGGEITDSNHGAINSPGYPGVYPNDRDCVWRVSVDAGQYITIAFGTLRLEHHDTCEYDYVEVSFIVL